MAYLNFTDQLMEAKRRARLQGRNISQQEAAGISEGAARAGQDRSVQIEQLAQNKEQYEKGLEENKRQFGQSLAFKEKEMSQRESEFGRSFQEQISHNARQYELAVRTLEAQIAQYQQSSAEQRAQFGAQMEFQIGESARRAEEFRKTMEEKEREFNASLAQSQGQFNTTSEFQKAQFGAQLAAAGQPLPSIFAPEGWNPTQYLKNNPDVNVDPFYGKNPLNHYYLLGKGEGRTYK